jgi:hypothetical protein
MMLLMCEVSIGARALPKTLRMPSLTGQTSFSLLRRVDDIIRRAAELKRQQEALAAELSALGEDVDVNTNAGASALDPALLRLLESDPSRSLELPPGVLRTELERLLGLRPDAAASDPLANGIQYEECEAMARAIEETGIMPPPPPDMFTSPPEPAESFLARLNGSIEDFEKFLQSSRRERARLKREFAAAAAAADESGSPKAEENDPRFAQGEEEDGGDGFDYGDNDNDDADDADDDFSLFDQELTESIPAPDIPVEALEAAHRAHRVLLVLRRIFVAQTDVQPLAFLEALSHRDLLAPDFVFSDPWINLTRAEEAWRYLTRMNETGAAIDFDVMFLGFDEYEPKVKGRVVAHTLFRMPLPHWYLKYLCIHGLSDMPEESDEGPRRRKGEPMRIWRGDGPGESSPGCEMYPRHTDGTSDSIRHSEAGGRSHVLWLCKPFPIAAQRQALVRNDDCIVEYSVEEEGNTGHQAADEEEDDVLIVGWSFKEWSTNDTHSKLHMMEGGQRIFPDYSALPSVHSMLVNPVRESFGNGAWYASCSLEDSQPPALPPLPRPRPANLEEDPLNPDEAEQLLRELLGDKKFEEIAQQLPPKAPPVTGPAIPDHLCFGATWSFDVHPDTGKVCNISLTWSWVGGPFCDERDAYDVWIAETGLLEDYEDAST